LTSSILILGINPSSGKPNKTSATIQRLNRWMDILNMKHYSFTNVIHVPGKYHQNMVDYDTLRLYIDGHMKIIALGPFVSKTLNKLGIEHFTLPHPSPLNRKLNNRDYELEQLTRCKHYLEE
jgi:hypothetical protein